MGTTAHKTEEIFLVDGGQRPTPTDGERDDAKQVLTVALAAVQRERAAADQSYVRGRNFLAFTATLFTAVQAAFLANVGREVDGAVLLSASERGDIVIPAVFGALTLLGALVVLLAWLDKPRDIAAVGANTLTNAWLDPHGQHKNESVLDVLVVRAIQEEREWSIANKDRKKALGWIGVLCGLAGFAALLELVILYIALT